MAEKRVKTQEKKRRAPDPRPDPKLRRRAARVLSLLSPEYPNAETALEYRNPLQMLVSTILSAQCTDAKVNEVTITLFKKYRTVQDFANASLPVLQREIHQTGFFRNKAKNIKGSARALIENYDGEVPRTMEELLTLPGVARKTANIVLQNAFGIVEGIAVDTHVKRLSQRLGLSKNKDPNKIELDLMRIVPKKNWALVNDLLIWHGRRICKAQKPRCDQCILRDLCPSASDFTPESH